MTASMTATQLLPDLRRCVDCGAAFPTHPPRYTGGAGYGTAREPGPEGPAGDYCYPCAATRDRRYMAREGRVDLYLVMGAATRYTVQNWPGSLVIKPTDWREHPRGSGGFGGARRVDVWFCGPDGQRWHGINRGDSQVVRCKRLKGRA